MLFQRNVFSIFASHQSKIEACFAPTRSPQSIEQTLKLNSFGVGACPSSEFERNFTEIIISALFQLQSAKESNRRSLGRFFPQNFS